ncbi:MAG: arginine repressor [Gemmatimonadota bacterium]|nr:arginine repressor [Gemmatimonadota bacterium]MDE2983773.1 arginine repressor [Gemmatimonadota bacterium]
MKSGGKRLRQAMVLRIIREHRIPHQEALRARLAAEGFPVAQATLSRDIRDLRLVKVVGADGKPHYTLPEEWENLAPLDSVLPALFVSAEPVGNLIVVRTLSGAAQAVASGIDWEEFEGLAGTIAGDDTVLVILRTGRAARDVAAAIEQMAAEGSR